MPFPYQNPLIPAELVRIASIVPGILTIYLYTDYGLGIAFHSTRNIDNEEDIMSAMAHAWFHMNQTIATRLRFGKWQYYVASTEEGRCLYLPIPSGQNDLVLILILAPKTSIETLIAAVKSNWQTLLELTKDL